MRRARLAWRNAAGKLCRVTRECLELSGCKVDPNTINVAEKRRGKGTHSVARSTDGRTLVLSRYTHPEPDHRILLEELNLTLPAQPPPRISSRGKLLNQT